MKFDLKLVSGAWIEFDTVDFYALNLPADAGPVAKLELLVSISTAKELISELYIIDDTLELQLAPLIH